MANDTAKQLRNPLQKARGLGSAKHGAEHWWVQRLSSLALIPLTIWFVLGVIGHLGADHAAFQAWMRSPVTAAMMILTVAVTFQHAASGMQVVYEDYLHVEWQKLAADIVTKFLCYGLAAACIVSVLKLSFGA